MRKIISLRIFQLIIVIIISLSAGFILGTNNINWSWKNYKPIVSIQSKNPPSAQQLDMRLFYEVFDRINQDYYDKTKIDSTKLLYGAINGLLSSLQDPYTSFFPPKENTEFKTQLAGEFTGIGAELSLSPDNRVMVVAPLDDTPAQKAGVRSSDLILKVNDEDTAGWTVPVAVEKIRGPKGTTVELTVLHDKEKTPTVIKIVRDTILIKSVTGWVKNISCGKDECSEDKIGPPIAYIRLSQFGDKTNDEWVSVANSINTKVNEKDFRGIILDVRNNPGGYLNDAVFVASEFLKSGVVVIQEDESKNQESLRVSRRGTLLEKPLIVLINKGSASASEIVAAALRDHKRAKLLGDKSFGKGTIQQAVDVDNGASLHISVAKWLTPKGTWINKTGLEPDIKVEFDATKSAKMKDKGFDNQLEAAIRELLK
ncbi:MAG: S41 family peptidase [Candidatus Levybacteria bacterium]|nr:S41 family peptidase [Candidatus Levybacteria bacterium]